MKSKKEILEKKYTSTTTKLLHNLDRLKEIKEGKFRPISIQIAPTDLCNLNCVFCSVKNRPMKELKKEEVCKVLHDFKELGAKSVEFTGGGDPTMYEHINEVIVFAKYLGYRVGLITNGVLLDEKLRSFALGQLDWVRVSLNGLDQGYDYLNLPKLHDSVVLGFSYVWNENSNRVVLDKIKKLKEKYGARYVRIVPDCREVELINDYKRKIEPLVWEYSDFFFQQKEYVPPESCRIGWLKPFVNSDGWVYHCSANPLIDLKFNSKFRMCGIDRVKSVWSERAGKPFSTSNCGECFFREHNELIENVMLGVEHGDFI